MWTEAGRRVEHIFNHVSACASMSRLERVHVFVSVKMKVGVAYVSFPICAGLDMSQKRTQKCK